MYKIVKKAHGGTHIIENMLLFLAILYLECLKFEQRIVLPNSETGKSHTAVNSGVNMSDVNVTSVPISCQTVSE